VRSRFAGETADVDTTSIETPPTVLSSATRRTGAARANVSVSIVNFNTNDILVNVEHARD
jgi:hypothetical protein